MCRNIRTLYNFDPPATKEEIKAASIQFVRKITGFQNPSLVNQQAFEKAITEIAGISEVLLNNLQTTSSPKNREIEAAKRRIKTAQRFSQQ
jgi:hypothetical protein